MNTQWKKRKKNWKLRLLWLWYRLRGLEAPMIHYINGTDVLPAPLTPEQEDEMTERLVYNDQRARGVLVEHNLRLVVYIAKKFENTGVNIEDLISIGTIGLIKAVNTFCKNKSIKLATYASRCIENEILMYLRKNTNIKTEISIEEPLNVDWDGNELLLSDILGTESDTVNKNIEYEIEKSLLFEALDKLGPREQQIIRMRFGLADGIERTQREVADQLHISQSYISRMEKKILERLKREIEKIS